MKSVILSLMEKKSSFVNIASMVFQISKKELLYIFTIKQFLTKCY
ncbi:protein of unknown function [Xenorhabdus poinarii G6]|uniref:Uncharacterized protein n=1 Tax=Xenorhabdus poinarii G6 TaxID=1354304 RepID=A0A068R795_9GAMM|nr:protein of unknown function [Xenorhabdus poinarii G6]